MVVLDIENVTTHFGDIVALSDVSFTVGRGEVLALVGHNGAGKSTLMKTILCSLEKTRGEIRILGKYSQDDHFIEFKRQISYLPEEPILLPELTVMQHFQLYAMSYQLEQKVWEERVRYYIKGFELTDKLHEFPEALSKGMRQKVQIICTLLPNAALLLIDEPFMGLDVYAIQFLEQELKIKVEHGSSILLTSHQLDRVKDLADSYVMLQHGKVKEMGTIDVFDTIERRTDD